jgi:thioesterase domain-containing protein
VGYAELARLLGEDQPFYGLQARGQDGATPPDESIEAMAAHYVEVIRAQQPHGPYRVGGYCFGGVVAFEVARQLAAQGEAVPLVAIFEGYAPARTQVGTSMWSPRMLFHRLRNLPLWLVDFVQLGRLAMWSRVRQAGRQRLGHLIWRLRLGMPLDMEDLGPNAGEVPPHIRRIMELHLRASGQYLPQPYTGRITLFNVRSQSLSRTPGPDRGWARLTRANVAIRRIAGAHHNILFLPHVKSLAKELGEALRETEQA